MLVIVRRVGCVLAVRWAGLSDERAGSRCSRMRARLCGSIVSLRKPGWCPGGGGGFVVVDCAAVAVAVCVAAATAAALLLLSLSLLPSMCSSKPLPGRSSDVLMRGSIRLPLLAWAF